MLFRRLSEYHHVDSLVLSETALSLEIIKCKRDLKAVKALPQRSKYSHSCNLSIFFATRTSHFIVIPLPTVGNIGKEAPRLMRIRLLHESPVCIYWSNDTKQDSNWIFFLLPHLFCFFNPQTPRCLFYCLTDELCSCYHEVSRLLLSLCVCAFLFGTKRWTNGKTAKV